jgi:hypothetical protein
MGYRLILNQAVGGGATVQNVLTGWQFQQVPWPAIVKLVFRSTTATDVCIVSTGSETVQERCPVPAGGTLGVTPTDFNTPALVFRAAQGDQLKMLYTNGGAASNLDGYIEITRAG